MKVLKAVAVFAAVMAAIFIYSAWPDKPAGHAAAPDTVAKTESAAATPEAAPPPAQNSQAETPPVESLLVAAPPAEKIQEKATETFETSATAPAMAATAEERQSCPADWTVMPSFSRLSGQSVSPAKPVGTAGDDLLLEPVYAHFRPALQGVISGGNLTLAVPGGTYINIDGKHIIGVGSFTLESKGDPDVINVLAPGLATMHGGHLTVIAGAGRDVVYLDGCLTWDKPAEVTHDNNAFIHYAAMDGEGSTASVDVLKGVEVRMLAPERIKAWAQAAQ